MRNGGTSCLVSEDTAAGYWVPTAKVTGVGVKMLFANTASGTCAKYATFHGDFLNAWNQTTLNRLVDVCLNGIPDPDYPNQPCRFLPA